MEALNEVRKKFKKTNLIVSDPPMLVPLKWICEERILFTELKFSPGDPIVYKDGESE